MKSNNRNWLGRNTAGAAVLLLIIVVAISCSKRRTREFIVDTYTPSPLHLDGWRLQDPDLIAFKDVIDLSVFDDTLMFWLNLRAERTLERGDTTAGDIFVDSVKITFVPGGEVSWRVPTRSAFYGVERWKSRSKLFDFFGDQGIVIPMAVDTVQVDFVARVIPVDGSGPVDHPVAIRMIRSETEQPVPLLRQ